MAVSYSGTPRVIRREYDLTTSPQPVGVTTGAAVIEATNGPVNQRIYITSRQQFQNIFGNPLKNPLARSQEDIRTLNKKNAGMYAANILLNEFEAMFFVRATDGKSQYANMYIANNDGAASSFQGIYTIPSTEALTDKWYDGYTFTVNATGDPGIRDYEEGNFNHSLGMVYGAMNPGEEGNRIAISVVTPPSSAQLIEKDINGDLKWIDDTGKLSYRTQLGTTDVNNIVPFPAGANGFNWLWSFDEIALTNETDDGEWVNPLGNIWDQIYKVNVYRRPVGSNYQYFEPLNQDLILLNANIENVVENFGLSGNVDFESEYKTASLVLHRKRNANSVWLYKSGPTSSEINIYEYATTSSEWFDTVNTSGVNFVLVVDDISIPFEVDNDGNFLSGGNFSAVLTFGDETYTSDDLEFRSVPAVGLFDPITGSDITDAPAPDPIKLQAVAGALQDLNYGGQYFIIANFREAIEDAIQEYLKDEDSTSLLNNLRTVLESATEDMDSRVAEIFLNGLTGPIETQSRESINIRQLSFALTSAADYSYDNLVLQGFFDERTNVHYTSSVTPTSARISNTANYFNAVAMSNLIDKTITGAQWEYLGTNTHENGNTFTTSATLKSFNVETSTYEAFSFQFEPISVTVTSSSAPDASFWETSANAIFTSAFTTVPNLNSANLLAWSSANENATSTLKATRRAPTTGTTTSVTYEGRTAAGSTQTIKQSYWDRFIPVESYFCSNFNISNLTGDSLFVTDVINGSSNLIYIPLSTVPSAGEMRGTIKIESLRNGANPPENVFVQISDKTAALNLLEDREKAAFDILVNTDLYEGQISDINAGTYISYQRELGRIAASRMDSIAVVQATGMGDDTPERQLRSATRLNSFKSPSYVAMYAGFDRIYDPTNAIRVVVPKSVAGAYIMARTDRVARPWNAPAGTDRGVVDYTLGSFPNISGKEYGVLYDNNVNTTLVKAGHGNVMWGQKTAQLKKTALDRINVRRMLLYVENHIEKILEPFILNSENSPNTWNLITKLCSNFLADVLNGGGILQYQVICDATNNDLTSNTIRVAIAVVPVRTVEYIEFTTYAIDIGVSISGDGIVITEG